MLSLIEAYTYPWMILLAVESEVKETENNVRRIYHDKLVSKLNILLFVHPGVEFCGEVSPPIPE